MTTETEDIVIAEVAGPLTTIEQQQFLDDEHTIAQGLDTFVAVGEALGRIRDARLYRSTHASFADYLAARWPQIGSRRQADRLIEAAEVERDLRPIGLSVANEAQARALAPLAPDERRQAMQQAVQATGGKPTAKDIQRAAAEIRPPARPAPAAPPPLPPPPPPALAPVMQALPPALALPGPGAAAAGDLGAIKLLVAKQALLAAVLARVQADLADKLTPHTPSITIADDQVADAARVFAGSPALSGAAAMLAFAATVGPAAAPAPAPPLLTASVDAQIAAVEHGLATQLAGDAARQLDLARTDLDAMAASLDDATYNALAHRISTAYAAVRARAA